MRALLAAALLLALLPAPPLSAQAADGVAQAAGGTEGPVIVLVRHAEKEAEPADDPPLTAEGRERALELAALFGRSGVTAVLSSDYRRTRETAAPLAEAAGLHVELYDPRDLRAVAADVSARSGVVVVVGHSNTTPVLAQLLGGDPGEPIDEAEYDRIYVLHPHAGGGAATVVLRFGRAFAGDAVPAGG